MLSSVAVRAGRTLISSWAVLAVAGCGPAKPVLVESQLTQRTPMSEAHRAAHAAMHVLREDVTVGYQPIRMCQYVNDRTPLGKPAERKAVDVTIRKIGNKLSIVETSAGQPLASILIEPSGKVLDYNDASTEVSIGQRYTPESAAAVDAQVVRTASQAGRTNVHAVNEQRRYFPEYLSPVLHADETAALLTQEDGAAWASFVYRGTTLVQGHRAALLDLVRTQNNMAFLVGYTAIDVQTGMPLVAVLDTGTSGTHDEFTQISCR